MTNVIKLIFGMFTAYTAGMIGTVIAAIDPISPLMIAPLLLAGAASFLIFPAMTDIIDWLQSLRPVPVHPGTGLPFGDHGSAEEAMTWAMTECPISSERALFLWNWYHGQHDFTNSRTREYYEWLYEKRMKGDE